MKRLQSLAERIAPGARATRPWLILLALAMLPLFACNIGGGNNNAPTPTEDEQPVNNVPVSCQNDAELVADGDGTPFGESGWVTKTWFVRNSGDCPWTPDYEIVTVEKYVFDDSGERELRNELATTVEPGQESPIAVGFHAPTYDGVFALEWQLEDHTGGRFGDLLSLNVLKSGTLVCTGNECTSLSPMIYTCPDGDCGTVGDDGSALAICAEGDCGIPAMGVYACDGAADTADVSAAYALDPDSSAPVICIYGVEPGEFVVGTVTDPSGNVFTYNGPAVSLPNAILPELDIVDDDTTLTPPVGVPEEEVTIRSEIIPGRWEVTVDVGEQELVLPPLEILP